MHAAGLDGMFKRLVDRMRSIKVSAPEMMKGDGALLGFSCAFTGQSQVL